MIVTEVAFGCCLYIPGLKESFRYPPATFLSQETDSKNKMETRYSTGRVGLGKCSAIESFS